MRTLSISSVLYFTLCNNYTLIIRSFYKYYYNYVHLGKTTTFKGLFTILITYTNLLYYKNYL